MVIPEDGCWLATNEGNGIMEWADAQETSDAPSDELFTVAEMLRAHLSYLAARYGASCQTPDQAQTEPDQTQTESSERTSDT